MVVWYMKVRSLVVVVAVVICTVKHTRLLLGIRPDKIHLHRTNNNNNNNNNNTSICKAHNVSIRAESEAPAVARWRGWLEG